MEHPTPPPDGPVPVPQQFHGSEDTYAGYSSAESPPHHAKSSNASVLDSPPHLQNLRQKGNKRDSDSLSEKISADEFESSLPPEASPADNIEDWKRRLAMLVQNNNKQELVSMEKKDRRDFEEISALASKMGLFSHVYAKAAVISKLPLPHYRFDLDDRRPKREVILPHGLLKRVEAHLKEYLSHKPRFTESFIDKSFPVSSRSRSTATDEGLLEESEPSPFLEKILMKKNSQLQEQQQDWQESPEGKAMLKLRQNLPAHKEKDVLLKAISKNQVIIISGHTGCGKTTQIPQFILESEIDSGHGALCNILCTQPRRISAISVSERVASERGEKLGESVGYKVRMEGVKGPDTHLLFCTTGVLLRRFLVDRNLKNITHIIVDEIHERGINEDFLLIVLKELLPRRSDLRVILMSATLDAELFSSYFDGAPIIQIPGFTHPVRTHFLEDILKKTGYTLTPFNQIDDYGQEKMWKTSKQAPKKRKTRISSAVEGPLGAANYGNFSPHVRDSLTCWDPESIGFNLIEHVLSHICEHERQGAILVFMIGWEDIRSLKDKLQSHPVLGDQRRVLLLACHGSMPSSEQRLIFGKAAIGVRKIVLATNIAETSITINDVVFVVDCGKAKETSYDALNNTPCLLPSWISKASAQQRRGRAGRVQPGDCYHLYPKCVYEGFAEYQLPEILRMPLQTLCLQIKSLELGSISEFLSRALQSPESLAVENAVDYLKLIGALDNSENLTVLGSYLAILPVEPKLGKMLVYGAIFNCLNPILTVVAGLTVRDPFLTPSDNKDSAEAAKLQFACDYSDHLALARAYEGWKEAEIDSTEYDYCCKNFLSLQSMKAIDSLREEFLSLLSEAGLVDSNSTTSNVWSYDEHLLRAVICSGLYPGVCSVMNTEKSFSLRTMEDGQVVLHGSSVNAHESSIPYPWLVFNERVKVKCVFIHDSTAVSDSVLLLFGGSILKGDTDGHIKMLEGYLEFFMDPSMVEMFQTLRREIDEIIQNKLQYPWMDINCYHELLSATRLLLAEYRGSGRFFVGKTPPKTPISVPKTQVGPGPGGENPKGDLQTLLARRGEGLPTYKVTNLETNMFLASVEFSGVHVKGHPCHTKKAAEKDAAAEALKQISGWKRERLGHEESKSTKKKKKKH